MGANPRRRTKRKTTSRRRVSPTYSPKSGTRRYYSRPNPPRRRRRRPSATVVRKKQLTDSLYVGMATGAGLVAVRTGSNMALKGYTGYYRAGADVVVGFVASLILNAMKVSPRIVAGLLTGAVTSATIRVIDELGGEYVQVAGIGGVGNYFLKVPPGVQATAREMVDRSYGLPQGEMGDYYMDTGLRGMEPNIAVSGGGSAYRSANPYG